MGGSGRGILAETISDEKRTIMTPANKETTPDLKALLSIAVAASVEAGKAVLEVYSSDFAVEKKEDKSPLTLADKRSHEIISRKLMAGAAGDIPLLSEEGRDIPYAQRKAWEHFWLVDPLDGTKEFIKRNGEFTVNIALIRKTAPILGVIYIPVKDVLYFAAEGMGAYRLDGASTAATDIESLLRTGLRLPGAGRPPRPFSVVASRSHLSKETDEYLHDLNKKHEGMTMISAGSSLKFCLIAEDLADVYPRFAPTMEWDTGAGQAIVEEAGGIMVDAKDRTRRMEYNKQVLTNGWFIAARKDRVAL
jgi:3'(2'), 5'-bisphosphate nucleotidase